MAGNKLNWLIWRGMYIEWEHKMLRSKHDLTPDPHFELTVTDKDKDETIHFDNVQLKDMRLMHIRDLTKLPQQVQAMILDNAVDTLLQVEANDATH